MGFKKATITVSGSAPTSGNSIVYISTSAGRSISLVADTSGTSVGTFKTSGSASGTAANISEALLRDLNETNVFGPFELVYDGFLGIQLSILDESLTNISVSGSGDLSGDLSASISTINVEDQYSTEKKINVRSPYFFTVEKDASQTVIDSARLDIYVYSGNRYQHRPDDPTYRIISSATSSSETSILFNLAEYAKDYFTKQNLNEFSNVSDIAYVDVFATAITDDTEYEKEPEFFRAFYGYGYIEDGVNPQNLKGAMISNDRLIIHADAVAVIPVDTDYTTRVTCLDEDGDIILTSSLSGGFGANSSTTAITYFATSGAYTGSREFNYTKILSDTTAVIERNSCADTFFDKYEMNNAKKIVVETADGVETITVETVEECKYEPILVKFVNKFGALQDIYFFKNNALSLDVESKDFRRGLISSSTTDYKTQKHQYKNLFKTGKESLQVNSGFYPESHNEVFKQLMLSEDVWVLYEGVRYPVNIKDSSMKFKTSITDKLIEYKLDLAFAFDKIQNIT